tara:strand:- start:67030 stop:67686 length:657 start_codon:yes stop_codon:yes gene_type:complete
MMHFNLIQRIILWAIPVIFAVTVHEVAHGWVANKLGDPTAKMLGRLTLNPIKHIDPLGTIIIPALMLAMTSFVFGWAKPVPITYRNLRNPRRDMALVALAGPVSNLIMALIWAAIAKAGVLLGGTSTTSVAIYYMGFAGILINLMLMVLNLIPIPPLDGSRVVASFLKGKAAYTYSRIEPFGFFILLGLLALGAIGGIMQPIIGGLLRMIANLFGLGI